MGHTGSNDLFPVLFPRRHPAVREDEEDVDHNAREIRIHAAPSEATFWGCVFPARRTTYSPREPSPLIEAVTKALKTGPTGATGNQIVRFADGDYGLRRGRR